MRPELTSTEARIVEPQRRNQWRCRTGRDRREVVDERDKSGEYALMSGLRGHRRYRIRTTPCAVRGDDGPMMSRTEYCPIAVGVDVLGDRWTPLVIRELTVGAAASAGPCSSSGFATSSAAGS